MLRTKLSLSRFLPKLAACCALITSTSAVAAPPLHPGASEPDYEASGFVVPAGYAGPRPAANGQVLPAGAPYGQAPMYAAPAGGPAAMGHPGMGHPGMGHPGMGHPGMGHPGMGHPGMAGGGQGPVAPVGYTSDPSGYAASAEYMGEVGAEYAGEEVCHGNCGGCLGGGCLLGLGHGGLMSRLMHGCPDCGGCGMSRFGPCGGCAGGRLGRLRHLCLFCQGNGCGVCQSIGRGHLLGALATLAPYTEGGLGAQRWYDLSAEALFLSLDTDIASRGVTSLGPGGPIVLSTGDVMNEDMEAGMRLSAAFICGPGGNVEVTYMGLQEWEESASVTDGGANLYSFISEYGTAPVGGFDDTDRSLFQGLDLDSRFHSGEVNYRRRWVGPYSRFQGSWLAGIRYVEFDQDLVYRTEGLNNDTATADDRRFFEGRFDTENSMTGFQMGGDLWWNVYPGINLGVGLKGAALDNSSDMDTSLESNSIGPGGVAFPLGYASSSSDSRTAWLTEFNATAIYRFAYSWSFRSSYYLINVDNVALGLSALDSPDLALAVGNDPFTVPATIPIDNDDSFTVQGVSFGLEYLW